MNDKGIVLNWGY